MAPTARGTPPHGSEPDQSVAKKPPLGHLRCRPPSPARLTLDFDGSVIGTPRMAEGTAVGYNKKKSATRVAKEVFLIVA